MYLIWLLLRSSTLCLFSCLYTYIYFSYLPLVFLVTQYYGTYEVEWFYDQCVIKKKKWIEGWGRCLLWGTVSEFEVLSPNLRYCLWIWGTVSEFEVLSLNLRYCLWIYHIVFMKRIKISDNLNYHCNRDIWITRPGHLTAAFVRFYMRTANFFLSIHQIQQFAFLQQFSVLSVGITQLKYHVMSTESFPGVKYGRGVLLTTRPLLMSRSWKSRAVLLPTLWASTGPVTGTLF
jgi:hypothetical protein